MEPSPSRLTEQHQTLVLDASVVINLLGSGHPDRLLMAVERSAVLVDIAKDEIRRDPSTGGPAATVITDLEERGLIRCVSLSDTAYATFLALVGAVPPDDIGDGEAATIAHAEEIGGTVVIDERKALRVASARPQPRPVLSTLDLFSSRLSAERLPVPQLADMVFASLRNARMRVPPPFRSWVSTLIGAERATQCSTLGGVSLSTSARFGRTDTISS